MVKWRMCSVVTVLLDVKRTQALRSCEASSSKLVRAVVNCRKKRAYVLLMSVTFMS